MNSYLKRLPFNHFHYYLFAALIGFLGLENKVLFLLYLPFYFLIKSYKNRSFVILVGCFFILYSSIYIKIFKQKPLGNQFLVINKITNDSYKTYYVKENFNKFIFYSNQDFEIGDVLTLKYNYEELDISRTPNGFNLKNFYSSKRVFYKLKIKEAHVTGKKFHLNQIRESLKVKLDSYPPETSRYLKVFLFAENTFSEEYQDAKVSLGIIHLFALSGLHINFLITIIEFIFKKLNIEPNKSVIYLLLLLYLWLTSFSVSLTRAVIMYIIFNNFKDKGLTRLDSLSVTFIMIIIINPFYRYRTGFILSFIVSFLLIISPYKSNLKSVLVSHYKIILLTLLLIANINGGVYPLSFLTSFIFTIIFPIVIMPLLLIGLIPFLAKLIEPFLSGFSKLTLELGNNFLFKIPYQGLTSILIYFSLFVYAISADKNKTFIKRSFHLIFYVFLLYVSPSLNFNQTVYFLDVGQGDATFIQNTFNKGNILIDANTGTLDFLKTLGNIEIDYFFITHGDLDHAADAKNIIEQFKVNNIVISPYDNSEIIKSLNKNNLTLGRVGDIYNINNIEIKMLGPLKNYSSLNNNSLVFQLITNKKTYLFTGDAEEEAVADLTHFYKEELKSDILHVSHHGGKGGTPLSLLNYVLPKEAIISVGKNNFYNHPHSETINNLRSKNIIIFETSHEQTIIKKKYEFSFVKMLVKRCKI